MPIVRTKIKQRVQTMNGGEDSTSDQTSVVPPFATLMRGVDIDEKGKVIQRLGPSRTGDNPDTLILDMRFHDSSATDFKGNISTANTTETSVKYDTGKFAKSCLFNGTTSSIKIDAAETEISATTMVTFAVTGLIYVSSDGAGNIGHIIDKTDASSAGAAMTLGYRAWTHTESASTVKLSFEVGYGAGTNAIVETSTTINLNTFYKIEFHHNADKSNDILIDGVVASYGTDTTGVGTIGVDTSLDTYIGNTNTNDGGFDGQLEYFRIYDGVRTTTEYEQDKIYGLTRFKVGTTIDQLFRIRAGNLEELDTDFKGWTETATDEFTVNQETNFVQAGDLLFILNGEDNVRSMDTAKTVTDEGSTTSDPPTKAKYGAWAQTNRLFLAIGNSVIANRELVWFSATDDPQTFDTTTVTGDFFKVTSKKGGAVTWMEPFKLNELIIYKEDSIHVLNMTGATPLTDWQLQPVNVTTGCRAGRTVQDIGNDHIFLDHEGFVRLLSRTTFDKLRSSVISGPIQGILDTINIDAMEKSCSSFVNGKYYLAIPTGSSTENNVTLIWDSEAAALTGTPASGWSVVSEGLWYPSVFTTFEFGDNRIRLVHGDNRNLSMVFKHDSKTDNGKVITMEAAGPGHDFGDRGSDKIFGPLHVVWAAGDNTNVEMLAEIDEQGFESLGTFSLAGNAPILPIDLEFTLGGSEKKTELLHIKQLGRGKTCRIKAKHESYNNSATFIEYELYAEARIPKK